MAILANRVKNKGVFIRFAKGIMSNVAKILAYIILIFFLLLIYIYPSSLTAYIIDMKGFAADGFSIFYENISGIRTLIFKYIIHAEESELENRLLRQENARLRSEHDNLMYIYQDNKNLRKILNVASEADNEDFVTARLLSVSSNPFAKNAILSAGLKDGVNIHDSVKVGNILLGRVIEVGDNYCLIMLIEDKNSRIPVITSLSRERGVLLQQDGYLKIVYLREGHKVSLGEDVFTSGDGKIYPNGLKVARVNKVTENDILVTASIDLSEIEFVVIKKKSKN